MIARTARLLDAAAAADRALATPIWPRDRACPPAPAMPPLSELIFVDGDRAILPDPSGKTTVAPIGRGVAIAWAPTPELGGITLALFLAQGWGGFVATLTRPGLRSLISDLQAIDAQLEDAR